MFITKKRHQKELLNARLETREVIRKEQEEKRLTTLSFRKRRLLGKTIIAIANEVDDLYIGQVINFLDDVKGNTPRPVIFDCIRKSETFVFSSYRLYTPQLFSALIKLSVEERIELMYPNVYDGQMVQKYPSEEQLNALLTKEKYLDILAGCQHFKEDLEILKLFLKD